MEDTTMLYQELMKTADILGIPLDTVDYYYEAFVEFVREEFNKRIKTGTGEKIDFSILTNLIMAESNVQAFYG